MNPTYGSLEPMSHLLIFLFLIIILMKSKILFTKENKMKKMQLSSNLRTLF